MVSATDIYAHPAVRSFAQTLIDVARTSAKPAATTVVELPTPTNTREYDLGFEWVTIGDGSMLALDSLLMKKETLPAHTRLGGNPARET